MSEATQAVKSLRTPAQIEVLERARIKANAVRKANADLKQKQREIDIHAKVAARNKIEAEHAKIIKPQEPEPQQDEPEEPEPVPVPVKKIKNPVVKKKPVIILMEESDGSDEEDDQPTIIRLPKRKPQRSPVQAPPVPEPSPADIERMRRQAKFQKDYNAMFHRPLF